ncbi:MAG: HNH endonuclease signature motif containing protein [Pleurocapsa sp. MO_192.B19]|nr:HNH endonuclease signature motif containing protein [Pleurocapsa sp. MO_192.B19]
MGRRSYYSQNRRGKNEFKNLQLLHRRCHHEKTGIENQQRYVKIPYVAKSLRSCMQ